MTVEHDERVEESEFDTRSIDLGILGDLLEEKTQYYLGAMDNDLAAMREYRKRLKAIYKHISYFVDEDSEVKDEIDEKFKQANKRLSERNRNNSNTKKALEFLEDADDKINLLRKEANLAMPTKNKVNPGSAGVDELE